MRSGFNSIILVIFILLIDIYVFQAVRALMYMSNARLRNIVYGVYWFISIAGLLSIALLPYVNWQEWPANVRAYVMAILMGLVLAKLIVVIFLLLDDMRRGIQWLIGKISAGSAAIPGGTGEGISRSQFFSKAGLLMGGTLFATLLYGFSNKYNYRIHRLKLGYKNLPPAFKGLKVVQISDIHAGSFGDKAAVMKGVETINAQKADLVLFTGDLVNDRSLEMDDYMEVFRQIKAPLGVFSTLGNHDYGDYFPWPDKDAGGYSEMRVKNLDRLKEIHGELGWRLLMNEHVLLEREGQQIAVIGIENWSAIKRFPRYGDLKKAYSGTEAIPFKILLSHDPTHWRAQVQPEYQDIDLMLAGHTHGMQFGVEIPGFKWSPAQYLYKEWAGLYKQGEQRLYVNRGFGFLGYPGRVGILPEITVIELV
jgi:predicted MPP superfamily phosphohydrolase